MRLATALMFGLTCCVAHAEDAGRWRLQYFYDKERATFAISDLKFPSSRHGVAIGAIVEGRSVKPMSAITSDGGANWSLVPIEEPGQSLFFLNDSLGWMLTTKSLWRTEEAGRSWRKLKTPAAGLIRVHFLDSEHGWAVGARKQIYETRDGGASWTKLAAVDQIQSTPEWTRFAWIEFVNKDVGMIGGWSQRPQQSSQDLPDWVDPESATGRRERPHLVIELETRDGGKTWTPSSTSMFGRIVAARFSSDGWGLALVEFSDTFDWPSELFALDWKTGRQPKRIYRDKERKITDAAIVAPAGPIYLAAIEHFGKLQQLPIPSKVKVLRSYDAVHWSEMQVDYRATARRVILASAGAKDVWAATDTGMILKLEP